MQISLRLLCFLLLYLSLFLFLIGCSDDREEQVNIEENLSDDLLNILATFNSVKFEFNTQWALESTTVQAALDRSGKVGDLVGKLGKIDIGFTNNTREGTYTVAKWGGPNTRSRNVIYPGAGRKYWRFW